MSKQVLLNALVGIRYRGEKLSFGQQFYADADAADKYVADGAATRLTPADVKALDVAAQAESGATPPRK